MNRKHKGLFVGILLSVIGIVAFGSTFFIFQKNQTDGQEQQELTVVTSFYPMYIAAQNIIGDTEGVVLENLSEPETGCLHDYQLTPQDMRLLSAADVFIVNGGGIEYFLTDVAAGYPELTILDASDGITLFDEDNAHVWMSVSMHMIQVENITEGLAQADPAHAEGYRKNEAAYLEKLRQLAEQEAALKERTAGSKVVLFHEAYAYLAEELGMEVVYVLDLDEERQVSAGEVADLLQTINENDVYVVLAEEDYGKDMGDVVDAQSQATTLYLDTLVRGTYDKDSYLQRMGANLSAIEETWRQL
jgi:zinc transport system substrate-binding protein